MTIKRKWGESFDDAFDRVVAEQDARRGAVEERHDIWRIVRYLDAAHARRQQTEEER